MRADRIAIKISEKLDVQHIELADESHLHDRGGEQTHLKLIVVSEQFRKLSRVERQRSILSLLDAEFKTGLHALTIRALTPEEWQSGGAKGFESPICVSRQKP